jgi:hypothetical protein
MKLNKLFLYLVLVIGMPFLSALNNEQSTSSWGKNSFSRVYGYFFGSPQKSEPVKLVSQPVGLQLIPHLEPYKVFPLLKVMSSISKLNQQAIYEFLERTSDQQLLGIYETTEMLKKRHEREKHTSGYPATEIQKLQARLFNLTEAEKAQEIKGNITILSDGGYILHEAGPRAKQIKAKNAIAKMLNCTPESLQDKTCAPIINEDDVYTKEDTKLFKKIVS